MRHTAFVLLILLAAAPVLAEDVPPSLLVDMGGRPQPMRLAQVDVEARIVGFVAETTMTLVFANPHKQEFEGDLYFPLPPGAVLCGYALDVEGKMIDGVAVDAEEGRQAYESLVRRRIDPGLTEWVSGNTFRSRVYPIAPNGKRTASIRFAGELVEEAGVLRYRLPLAFKDPIDSFRLRMTAEKSPGAPRLAGGGPLALDFREKAGVYTAAATLKGAALTQPLVIDLPQAAPRNVIVEKSPDGKMYFYLRASLAARAAPEKPSPLAPRRIAVLWDASGSRARQNHVRELRLLKAYLAALKAGPVLVDLVVFRHVASPPQRFVIEKGDSRALLKAIEAVEYDGGTRLAALTPAAGAEPPDVYLLFSDGVATLAGAAPGADGPAAADRPAHTAWMGPSEMPLSEVAAAAPGPLGAWVYVFCPDEASADVSVLRQLVRVNGGAYFSLSRKTSIDGLVAAMAAPRVRLLGVAVKDGKAADLAPRLPGGGGDPFGLLGRLESDEATVAVTYQGPDGRKAEARFVISARDAVPGCLVGPMWAGQHVAGLLDQWQADGSCWGRHPHEAEIIRLGKQFGLVTPYTSLIVLESLQQYMQFAIRPPDTLPKMRKAYDEQMGESQALPAVTMDTRAKAARDPTREAIYNILIPWYYRLAVWDDEPSYPPDFRYRPPSPEKAARGGVGAGCGGTPGEFTAGGGVGANLEYSVHPIVVAEAAVGGGSLFGGRSSPVPSGSSGVGSLFGGGGSAFGSGRFEVGDVTAHAGDGVLARPMVTYPVQDLADPARGFSVSVPQIRRGEAATPAAGAAAMPPASADDESEQPGPVIVAGAKDAERSYLKALAAAAPERRWEAYLGERRKSASVSNAFFIDCAEFFLERGDEARAVQIMSNLTEHQDRYSARTLARRLLLLKRPDLAARVLADSLAIFPDDPLALYDLAAILAQQGRYARAVEVLHKVVRGEWTWGFSGVACTALVDMNRLLPKVDPAEVRRLGIDRRLIRRMDADLRVVVTWEGGDDVDVAVTEPSGEKCFYDHAATTIGGMLWCDVANTGGPEEYMLRRAMAGRYKIEVGLHRFEYLDRTAPVRVRVDVYTHFARPGETHEVIYCSVSKPGEAVLVKDLPWPPDSAAPASGAKR